MSEPDPRLGTEPPGSLIHEPPSGAWTHEAPVLSAGYGTPPPMGAPYATHPTGTPSERSPMSFGATPAITVQQERNWAVAAHLSGFVAAFFALGFVGPLIVLLTGGARSAYVRRHAVEALNFNLSVLLWLIVSGVLTLVLVGFLMFVAVGVTYVVASLLGAAAAARGEDFRYPMTIRFVS